MHFIKQHSTYLIVFLFVVILFHCIFNLQIVNPENISWLMSARHDWGQHYLGWAFYRNEPWTFPLGSIEAICYPSGTNVGYMDSIPLLAFIFKIFSFALPEDFQYLGAWLFFCYLMTAYYTVKILKLYSINTVYIVLAALLIVFNPVLVYRVMHPALCAHWLILAGIYLYLKPATKQNVNSINRQITGLVIITALINPYLCFFIAGFAVIIPFRHYFYDKLISLKRAIIYPVVCILSIPVLWYLFGMLTFNNTTNLEVDGGYGVLSLNLNAVYNTWGSSKLLSFSSRVTDHQYEGFLYLGVGLMILFAISIVCFFAYSQPKRFFKTHKNLLPLLILGFLMVIFAISHKVSFNDRILFELPYPKFIIKLGNVFRASGRAAWVCFYMALLFFVIILLRSKIPQWLKVAVLVVALVIQGYDLQVFYFGRQYTHGSYNSPLDEEKWSNLVAPFKRIITYPPYNNHLLNQMDYQDLCFVALKNNKAISTGYTARENLSAYKVYTDSLTSDLEAGVLHEEELYVTTPQYLDVFDVVLHNKAAGLDYMDGYYIIYPKNKEQKTGRPKTPEALRLTDSVMKNASSSNIVNSTDKFTFIEEGIKMNIDRFSRKKNNIKVMGWAFLENSNSLKDSVFVTLSKDKSAFVVKTHQILREDVAKAFNNVNYTKTGFSASFFTDEIINSEDYVLGVVVKKPSGESFHYRLGTLKEMEKEREPNKISVFPDTDEKGQLGWVEEATVKGGRIIITGWAALENVHSDNTAVKIVFTGPDNSYTIKPETVMRPDVTSTLNTKYRHDTSGFNVILKEDKLPKGDYQIGIIVEDIKTGKKSFKKYRKTITVKQ